MKSLNKIKDIPTIKFADVDETVIDIYLYREYGRSKREPLKGTISGHKFKRIWIVAPLIGKTIIPPLQYDGTMDSKLFEMWFKSCLLLTLLKHSFIVMMTNFMQ